MFVSRHAVADVNKEDDSLDLILSSYSNWLLRHCLLLCCVPEFPINVKLLSVCIRARDVFDCRLVTKTYRLINIKSTTPEELYAHKVCKFHCSCSARLQLLALLMIHFMWQHSWHYMLLHCYYGCPMEKGRPLYFHPVVSSSSVFFSFFSSPNLSRSRLD